MIKISVKADIRSLERGLDAFARKQLPFATAMALNAVGKAAVAAEQTAMRQDLDRPRPFTANSGVRLKPATKATLTAMVFIPPIQSAYLAPEILGGAQALGSKAAVLRPIDQATDQYGNLPRGFLARMRGRNDVFIGVVRGVDGVWQRIAGKPPTKRKPAVAARLRLLVRFSDPDQVKTRYPFGQATIAAATALFPGELRAQLKRALLTAR